MQPLDTERLRLRLVERADAPALQALVSDRRIAETTLNIPYPYPESGAVDWITRVLERREQGQADCSFVILRRSDNVLLGAIGIHPDDAFQAEIGYWMGVPYWGQGYMTEAARRVIQFGFEALELNRIRAWYFTHNPASARVMQKAGMTFEGIMRQHYVKWNKFVDVGCYSILRSEYEAQRQMD
ncbi:MAG: GNAT family N-acetyltransferase [Anaerolineae bacterium]|nr:GNAT family N-acetyltransferase [Anaerolineae bacterium]